MPASENPFAAPQSADHSLHEPLPELHGRMPASVVVALVCTGVMVALAAALFGLLLITFRTLSGGVGASELAFLLFFLGMPMAVGGIVLFGLFRRSRLARQWARLTSALGGVLAAFATVSMAVTFLYFAFDPGAGGPSISPTFYVWSLVSSLMFYALPCALLWTIFIALGKPTAKQWFGLVCPSCNSRRVKAANFLYTQAVCKDCGEVC